MHTYIKDGLLAQGFTPVKERPGAGRGLVLGLTGGIASGKSAVAALFAAEGAVWISADQVARDVVGAEDIVNYTPRPNPLDDLMKRFGARVGAGLADALGLKETRLR